MKPKTNIINQSLKKEKCVNFFNRHGYGINKNDKHTIVLKKPGTIWTFNGKDMPLEITILFRDESTQLSLKYDAFALFDTGDLQKELDEISIGLMQSHI